MFSIGVGLWILRECRNNSMSSCNVLFQCKLKTNTQTMCVCIRSNATFFVSTSCLMIYICIIVLYYRLAEHIDRYMAVVQ